MAHRPLRILLASAAVTLLFGAASASAATFAVTSRNDANDGTCDGPHCSLREAILAANATAGADQIVFTDSERITPTTQLPAITETVFITALPSGRCDTDSAPLHLDGAGADFTGLVFAPGSDGSHICLVTVGGFDNGIDLQSDRNTLQLSRIGTDPAASTDDPNEFAGIVVSGSGNLIGGEQARHRNVISGNPIHGVFVEDGTANRISGNRIGTDATGVANIPNGTGVFVSGDATGTIVGGTTPDTGNVISGNSDFGVDAGAGRIVGNRIGVDPRGTSPLPNGGAGVHAFGPVQIGGRLEAERNLISGNQVDLLLDGPATVEGNWVGFGDDGFELERPAPLARPKAGIQLRTLADGALIGGGEPGAGNVIAGQEIGIVSEGEVDRVTVAGNLVGLSLDGELAIPTLAGIQLGEGATRAQIGGTEDGAGNTVIADLIGILISGEGTQVEGNIVGLDRAGDAHGELSDDRDAREEKVGIVVDETAENTTIGGDRAGAGNTVSGLPTGIELREGSADTVVEGNRVGTDAEGMTARPNLFGVVIEERAGVRIGGRTAAKRNVISGNQSAGVLSEALTADAVIEGNFIGLGADGVAPLGNNFGLELGREDLAAPTGSDGFVVGGTADGAGNRIAHNREDGVMVLHTAGGVALLGNEIFANGDGNASDLGIDFLGDGVSANGSQDGGVLPHFPLLTNIDLVSSGTSVQGTIDHPTGHQVRIELFASAACSDSGHGQGQTTLGAITLSAPGGAAAFSALVAALPAGQRVVTATATDLTTNRTSEFSRCALPSTGPPTAEPAPDDPSPGRGPGDPQPPPAGAEAGEPAPPIGLPTVDDDPPRLECVVPELVGITLAKAKKRLRAAGCGVGKVTKPKRRRGKRFRLVVKRSSLRAETVRKQATRIGLTLKYEPVKQRRSRPA